MAPKIDNNYYRTHTARKLIRAPGSMGKIIVPGQCVTLRWLGRAPGQRQNGLGVGWTPELLGVDDEPT